MPQYDGAVVVGIMGDNSEFAKSLRETNDKLRDFSGEIDIINRSLQLNPGNVELLGQKFAALGNQINLTRDKLDQLKAAEQEIAQKFANGEISSSQYDAFRREILNTEAALRDLIAAQDSMLDESGRLRDVTNELNPQIEETGNQAEKSGDKVSSFSKKLEVAAKIAKIGAAAIGAAATGISAISKAAVENYGEYEQLVGGVETLFKSSANVVQKYAANAYKTAGLSANQYMETVTSFSASLLQSLGGDTAAAAKVADKAITDMADNANKMGTDMQSIQNAYQGFAKDNYTMLDNLKLGYGGTKEEMQRLLDTANEYNRQQGINTNYQIENYADIVEAIHVVQTEMHISGITAEEAAEMVVSGAMTQEEAFEAMGTTAKEAATTIQGSLSAIKASWQNLLTGIADENADFGTLIDNFAESAATALDNLLPRVKTSLKGIGKLVKELSPVIAEAIPELVNDVSPEIVQAAVDLITILIKGLTDNDEMIVNAAFDILDILVNTLKDNAGNTANGAAAIIIALINGISDRFPDLLPAVVQIIAEIVKGLIDNRDEMNIAALKLIKALVEGLVKAILALGEELEEYCNEVCEDIADKFVSYDWDSVGYDIVAYIAQGIVGAKKLFDDAINTVVKAGANASTMFSGSRTTSHGGEGGGGRRDNNTVFDKEDAETAKEAGETYAEYMMRIGKQIEEDTKKRRETNLADYEEKLKAKKEELDNSLALRRISEEEYYQQIGEYLAENKNLESKEYFELLGKYEDYLDKKQKAADKAAEQQLKAEKTAAEKRQKEVEAAEKKAQKEAETAAKKAKQEAEKLLSEQEKTVEKSLSNIIKNFQKAYDELEKKRENYKKKLLSIGGDIFSVNEIENPDGSKTTEYAVNNISEQLRKIREFHSAVMKLKNEGASKGLLEELTSLDDDKSAEFAKYLARMSEAEFSKINALYNEKQKLAEELSNELYADEYKDITSGITSALNELSAGAADQGKEAADSYADAFKSEFEKRADEFRELLFGDSNLAAEIKATVESEQTRYSAAAYTAPVIQNNYGASQASEFKKSAELDEILKKLNKPVQVVLDGKVIAETVMNYQNGYNRQTGGLK